MKQLVYRTLASVGVGIERLRDPIGEIARLLAGTPVSTIVDGGAYVGNTVRRLRLHFPTATIHAFEPQQESFARLKENLAAAQGVKLHPFALSDSEGDHTLYVNETAYTTSLLPAEHEAIHQIDTRTVPVRKLDSVLTKSGVDGAEVIKLDLQGHELAALRGAVRTMATCRALLVEVNFRPRYAGSCSFEELAGCIGEYGLHLHRFYEVAVSAQDHGWLHGDALFVRR